MKKTYQYNGKTYTTIMEIAREIGKARLYQKDFTKYGITVVTDTPATYTTTTTVIDTPVTLTTITTYVTATTYTTTITTIVTEDEVIEKLERDVVDMTRYTFGKALSPLSMDALVKMAKNAGVTNLWENISNAPIRRMRMIMSLKEAYFPTNRVRLTPPPTPWKGIPFDKLAKVATDKGITWAEDNHPNINRMRLIMALKKEGIQATDI